MAGGGTWYSNAMNKIATIFSKLRSAGNFKLALSELKALYAGKNIDLNFQIGGTPPRGSSGPGSVNFTKLDNGRIRADVYIRTEGDLGALAHEMMHVKHIDDIGFDAYYALHPIQRETFVARALLSEHLWEHMTKAEQAAQLSAMATDTSGFAAYATRTADGIKETFTSLYQLSPKDRSAIRAAFDNARRSLECKKK